MFHSVFLSGAPSRRRSQVRLWAPRFGALPRVSGFLFSTPTHLLLLCATTGEQPSGESHLADRFGLCLSHIDHTGLAVHVRVAGSWP